MRAVDKEEIKKRITENKDKLRGFGVTKIGVFGSYVRNEQKKDSDIDLLVNFEEGKKTYRNFYNLAAFAEEVLGAEVDLLTPQSVSPYILPHIEKDIDYVQITN